MRTMYVLVLARYFVITLSSLEEVGRHIQAGAGYLACSSSDVFFHFELLFFLQYLISTSFYPTRPVGGGC